MAKKKLIEFSNELNINPNEVMEILKGTQYEVKNKNNILYQKAQDYVLNYLKSSQKVDVTSKESIPEFYVPVDKIRESFEEDVIKPIDNIKEFKNIEFVGDDKSIGSFEELSECEDIERIDETLEKRKASLQAEDITIKFLEEKIVELSKKILDIQEDEKERIKVQIDNFNKQREALNEEYSFNKKELEKEATRLEESYRRKVSLLEATRLEEKSRNEEVEREHLRKRNLFEEEMREKRDALEKEYEEKNSSLNKNFEEKLKNLEEDFNTKLKELEEQKKNFEEEYSKKSNKLEEEFSNKFNELEEDFNAKSNLLEEERKTLFNEYEKRNKELEDSFENKQSQLEEDFRQRNEQFEEESATRLAFIEDYEKDVYENCDEKISKTNEDCETRIVEVNKKIQKSKEEFESFMEEQKRLFNEQIKLKDEARQKEYDELNDKLTQREDEINKDYNEKLRTLKQEEVSILQKENELNERIDDLNKKVEHFNIQREEFVNRYYLVKNLYRKLKASRKTIIISFGVFLFICSYFFLVFEYTLAKETFISGAISNREKEDCYDNTFTIALDTSKSSLVRFTELDGLTLKLNYKFNDRYAESLNNYSLSYGNNTYTWERYYKDDTMIIKSPFYGQYIIVNDFKNKGYVFKKDQEVNIFLDSFREYLSKTRSKSYSNCSRLNITGTSGFLDYLRQVFTIRADYNYYYSFSDDKNGQKLFEGAFGTLINSSNFSSFEKEEEYIQTSLRYSNVLASTEDILKNIVRYSTVTNTTCNIKILDENKISVVDVVFDLDYQDNSMVSAIPMSIRFSCNFEDLENDASLEEAVFTINSIFYESLGV